MKKVTFRGLGQMGELGNQLFQIAATIGYARKHGFEEKFPRWVCRFSGRDYSEIFNGPVNQSLSPLDFNDPFQIFSYPELKYVEIPESSVNLDLSGYFQSERYFENCKEEIKSIFSPSEEVRSYLEEKYPDIMGDNDFVGVHIRTGKRTQNDYDVHAYCTPEYLEKAFSGYDDSKTFVIFSDKMDIAKEILPQGRNYVFIEGETNYADLFLLNNFKDYILSPSTFSWWGAWLSKYENPNVTISKDWFNPRKEKFYLNDNDISPERWRQI